MAKIIHDDSRLALAVAVRDRLVVLRNVAVLIDADVAALYGVETKRVNEAVRNNPDKFPADYMFELTKEERDDLRSKISSAKVSSKSRVLPKAFTEKGLYMLATVLKSKRAKETTFAIIETFAQVRVLPCRSGWQDVAVGMRNVRLDLYPKRHCLAVVDFDGCGEQRRRTFRQLLEENGVALERAYVMGPASNAEKMRRTLMERGYAVRHLSDVGRSLARACFQSQPFELLRSEELAHNAGELQRLCAAVKSFAMETE